MMASIWNETIRETMLTRLARLEPNTKPRWGKLTAPHLLCHLADQLRVASCYWEVAILFKGFWTKQPFKYLGIYVLPFRKNLKSPPEMFVTQPSTWHDDMETLHALLNEAVERSPQASWGRNPYFGYVNKQDWGVLIYRHFDHHFKQFGI